MFQRFKYDVKMIYREPIMLIFAILPVFLMFLFRYGLPVLLNFIAAKTMFEPDLYTNYIFAIAIIITPYMTGTLAGFLMLDERDGNVLELILITPAGFSGYLSLRLLIPVILSVVYTLLGFVLFSSLGYDYLLMPVCMILVILQSTVTALILFSVAKNKVQGLTFAKGLGLLMIPVFFDLLGNSFLNFIRYISPYYWIYDYIAQKSTKSLAAGIIVNLVWFAGLLVIGFRRTYKFKTSGM